MFHPHECFNVQVHCQAGHDHQGHYQAVCSIEAAKTAVKPKKKAAATKPIDKPKKKPKEIATIVEAAAKPSVKASIKPTTDPTATPKKMTTTAKCKGKSRKQLQTLRRPRRYLLPANPLL